MEEDAACGAGKDGGAGVGLDDGRGSERLELRHHLMHPFHHHLVRRQAIRAEGEELLRAGQHHAVVGTGGGGDGDAVEGVGGADGGAFAVDVPARLRIGPDEGAGRKDVGRGTERRGVFAHLRFPRGAIHFEGHRFLNGAFGTLAGEVAGLVFFRHGHLHVCLHMGEALARLLVLVIGPAPEGGAQGFLVRHRRLHPHPLTRRRAAAAQLPRVVERRAAHPQIDVEPALLRLVPAPDGAERAIDAHHLVFGDLIAQEIHRVRLLGEHFEGALKLALHRLKRRRPPRPGRAKERSQTEAAHQGRCGQVQEPSAISHSRPSPRFGGNRA